MPRGYIYIFSNSSYPGLLKIGRTKSVTRRVRELSSATAVPTPFEVEFTRLVGNAAAAESALHGRLGPYRTNARREFFRVSLELAKRSAEEICAGYAAAPTRPRARRGLVTLDRRTTRREMPICLHCSARYEVTLFSNEHQTVCPHCSRRQFCP